MKENENPHFPPKCFLSLVFLSHSHTLTPADVDTAIWLAGAATQYKHYGRAENSTLRNKCVPVGPAWEGCLVWVSSLSPALFSLLSVSMSTGHLLNF